MILGYNSYPYLISNHSSTNHHTTDSSAQYLTLIRLVSGIMHRWVPELNWSLPHAHMCVCVSVFVCAQDPALDSDRAEWCPLSTGTDCMSSVWYVLCAVMSNTCKHQTEVTSWNSDISHIHPGTMLKEGDLFKYL